MWITVSKFNTHFTYKLRKSFFKYDLLDYNGKEEFQIIIDNDFIITYSNQLERDEDFASLLTAIKDKEHYFEFSGKGEIKS